MGKKKGPVQESRRKAAAGAGRTARRERNFRKRSAKDLQAQLGQLHTQRIKRQRRAADTGGEQEGKSTGFENAYNPETDASLPRTPFERNFWLGPSAVPGEPPEDLKLQRKNLGIKVRGSPAPAPVESFADPGLPHVFGKFSQGARGSKLPKPTPIQMQVWPAALTGLDVLGIAPTGSGKTLAYLLPAVQHILGQPERPKGCLSPMSLVLLPTRELAAQVNHQCRGRGSVGQLFGLRAEAVYGGVGKEVQLDSLLTLGAPHLLAATPGRLLDLLSLQALALDHVTYLVLDEADRMLALGFEPQLDAIAKGIRSDRQCLLFSATFPGRLRDAAERWMSMDNQVLVRVATMNVGAEGVDAADDSVQDPSVGSEDVSSNLAVLADSSTAATVANAGERHSSGRATLTVSPTITQILHVCAEHKKPKKLLGFIDKLREDERQQGVRQRALVIIFCNQIKTLKSVANFLTKQHHQCAALHSGIPQAKREQSLSEFKAGRLLVLVATDLAARGLHIKHLKYVINYDFPSNLEQYCHRIGRTGRNGEAGTAFSFFTRNLAPLAKDLISLLERSGAKVDPNLLELVDAEPVGKSTTGSPAGAKSMDELEDAQETDGEEPILAKQGRTLNLTEDTAAPAKDDGTSDSESGAATGSLGVGGGLLIKPRKRHQGSTEDDSSSSESANEEADVSAPPQVVQSPLPAAPLRAHAGAGDRTKSGQRGAAEDAKHKSVKAKQKRARGKRGGKKHKV